MFPVSDRSSAANLGSFTVNTAISNRGNYLGESISPAVQHTINALNMHSNSESNLRDTEGFSHYNIPYQYPGQASGTVTTPQGDIYRLQQQQQQQQQPINLASMLDKLSLNSTDTRVHRSGENGMRQSIFNNYQNSSAAIKIKGLPGDLSSRECCLMFALARGVVELDARRESINKSPVHQDSTSDNVKVKGDETLSTTITARVNNLRMAKCYLRILKSKPKLLGPDTVNDYDITIIEESSKRNLSLSGVNQIAADSGFRVNRSSPNIPDMLLPQINTSNLPSLYPSQPQNPSSITQTHQSAAYATSMGPSLTFGSDSFISSFPLRDHEQRQRQQQSQAQGQIQAQTQPQQAPPQQAQTFVSGHPLANTSFGDSLQSTSSTMNSFSGTAGDVGKSFLLMEGDDINENIWNPNSPMFYSSQQNSMGLSFQQSQMLENEYQPQLRRDMMRTPFNIGSGSNTSVAAVKPQNLSIFPPTTTMQDTSNSFLGSLTTPTSAISSNYQMPFSASNPQFSSRATPSTPNVILPKQTRPQNSYRQTAVVNNGYNNNSNVPGPGPNTGVGVGVGVGSMIVSQNTHASPYSAMSQADLTLLSKIPPPANPADQNPPCNTLYVGNLPPDATEMELRQLFSGQPGFKRLSFRSKTNPPGHGHGHGHSHGPMCFVEFEDIGFATRALAELYGTQLPRAVASNKGGIRLSFSKNPLGVRGPNSRRSNSNTNVGSSSGGVNSNGHGMLASSSPLHTSPNRLVGSSNNPQHSFSYVPSFGKR